MRRERSVITGAGVTLQPGTDEGETDQPR